MIYILYLLCRLLNGCLMIDIWISINLSISYYKVWMIKEKKKEIWEIIESFYNDKSKKLFIVKLYIIWWIIILFFVLVVVEYRKEYYSLSFVILNICWVFWFCVKCIL